MPNGTNPATLDWRTSSYSTSGNQCVEVATLPDGHIAVRDSKNRNGGAHVFTPDGWGAFIASAKNGEFDCGTTAD